MRKEKPDVTVIYQDAPGKAPGFLAIMGELLGLGLFFVLTVLIAWMVGAM